MTETTLAISKADRVNLTRIDELDTKLADRFSGRLRVEPSLTRQLVSFQANKERSAYRWYKYKEAFSASLVEHFIDQNSIVSGPVLDPFAGMGTTLFVASALGLDAEGIELLPIGQEIIKTRLALLKVSKRELSVLRKWIDEKPWKRSRLSILIPTLRITKGAKGQNHSIKD